MTYCHGCGGRNTNSYICDDCLIGRPYKIYWHPLMVAKLGEGYVGKEYSYLNHPPHPSELLQQAPQVDDGQ